MKLESKTNYEHTRDDGLQHGTSCSSLTTFISQIWNEQKNFIRWSQNFDSHFTSIGVVFTLNVSKKACTVIMALVISSIKH